MKKRRGEAAVTRLQVLKVIYDDISISMVEMIQNNSETADSLTDKLNITHKQYYDRITKLLKTGIIKHKSKVYYITSFGKLIYQAHFKIAKATINLSTLKAIDAIKLRNDLSRDEYRNVVDGLIGDNELKDVLLSSDAILKIGKP
jgi:predicted transcriptional regulator